MSNPFRLGRRSCRFKWVTALALLFLSSSLSSCQLLALPFFAIAMFGNLASQLITQAFILPFQLLPLAIKYAPLALLFLEAPGADETFYVEWLKPGPYRVENFTDKEGREVTALIAPSEYLNVEQIRENFAAQPGTRVLVVTSDEFKDVQAEELRETWEVLKSQPGRAWVSGAPAGVVRRETLTAYV